MTNDKSKVLEVKGSTLTVFNADPGVFLMKFRTDYPTWLADSFPLATLDLSQAGDIPLPSAQLVVRTVRELKADGPGMVIKIAPEQEARMNEAVAGTTLPLRVVGAGRESADREKRKKEREKELEQRRAAKTRPPRAGLTTQRIEMEMLEDRTDSDDAGPKILELDGADQAQTASQPVDIQLERFGTKAEKAAAAKKAAAARPAPAKQAPVPQLQAKETLTLFLTSSDDGSEDVSWISMAEDPKPPVVEESVEQARSTSKKLPRRPSEPELGDMSNFSLRKAPAADGSSWVKDSSTRSAAPASGMSAVEGERRRWSRFQVKDAFALFKIHNGTPILKGDQLWKGPIQNLSQGGAQFVTSQAIAIGKLLRMLLDIPAFSEKIPVDARVIWVKDLSKGDKMFYRLGVSFEKITPDDGEKIVTLEENDELKNRPRT